MLIAIDWNIGKNSFVNNKCIDVWNKKLNENVVRFTSLDSFMMINFSDNCSGTAFDV